jgi:hypothetical protein
MTDINHVKVIKESDDLAVYSRRFNTVRTWFFIARNEKQG